MTSSAGFRRFKGLIVRRYAAYVFWLTRNLGPDAAPFRASPKLVQQALARRKGPYPMHPEDAAASLSSWPWSIFRMRFMGAQGSRKKEKSA